MSTAALQTTIDAAWETRESVNAGTRGAVRDAVEAALDALDQGKLRVAEKIDGRWRVHQWLKKAVLLSFRLNDMRLIAGAPGGSPGGTRCPPNSPAGTPRAFRGAGFRAVPGASCAAPPSSRRAWC